MWKSLGVEKLLAEGHEVDIVNVSALELLILQSEPSTIYLSAKILSVRR